MAGVARTLALPRSQPRTRRWGLWDVTYGQSVFALKESLHKVLAKNARWSQRQSRKAATVKAALVGQNSDSVTLSSSNGSFKEAAYFGGLAMIPYFGLVNNCFMGEHTRNAGCAALGVLANLGGTAALVGGMLTGNTTATNVGFGLLGLLGLSGLAGAFAGDAAG